MNQKTKIKKDIGNKRGRDKEKYSRNKTFKRAIRNKKNKNKKYDDLSLRISESEIYIVHYENDLVHKKREEIVIDIKVETLYFFTDKVLKIAYDIAIDNHYDKHANSIVTITPKFDKTGIDVNLIIKVMEETSHVYAYFINR